MEKRLVGCDLDGVICPEPTWLKPLFWWRAGVGVYIRGTALLQPLYYPSTDVYIITSRPETDRTVTQKWLNKHGIPYLNLFMYQDNIPPDFNNSVEHKINQILNLKLDVYIESDSFILTTLRLCLDVEILSVKQALKHKLIERR